MAILASTLIHTGWHGSKQEQTPHSMCVSALVVRYPKTPSAFPRCNVGSSSPNANPGGKAGCRKEKYDARVLSCGHYKREGLFWRTVCIRAGREGFERGTRTWGTRIKTLLWEY